MTRDKRQERGGATWNLARSGKGNGKGEKPKNHFFVYKSNNKKSFG